MGFLEGLPPSKPPRFIQVFSQIWYYFLLLTSHFLLLTSHFLLLTSYFLLIAARTFSGVIGSS
jgi:uncharacterized membrane protein (DUF485 family)